MAQCEGAPEKLQHELQESERLQERIRSAEAEHARAKQQVEMMRRDNDRLEKYGASLSEQMMHMQVRMFDPMFHRMLHRMFHRMFYAAASRLA